MSSDYQTTDVGSSRKGWLRRRIDTLQNLGQNVETVVRQSRFEIGGSQVDQIDAPDDLDELVEQAKEVGFVWKGLQIFANDVWEPGYRLEGPEETKAYFLGDTDEIDATPPEGTPEGGFLKNCAVFAGEKQQDFYDYGKMCTFQRRLRGTVLTELLKAEPENPESPISGFYFIRPETVSAEVYPNSNILIEADDTDQDGVEITKRGEAAAYIQFDDQSIVGRRNNGMDETEIPLSQNDVQKQVLNPGIGDDPEGKAEQGIFGTSEIRPVAGDMAEYVQIKADRATAIGNKSHGIWLIEHGREVLDLGSEIEIIEWDDESMDDFEDRLQSVDPGGHVTYDGSVQPERVDGDVPDIQDVIDHYVNAIISALPTPKYKIGFEDNINRDVTGEQGSDYERFISEEREYQERQWTKTFREIANRKGLPTEGLSFHIEPEPEDSPVLSMSTEEINKMATYAEALNALSGPTGGPQTLVDRETLITDIAQLPESVDSVDDLPEGETDAMSEFMDILEGDMDTLQAGEGDVVELPSGGKGVVVIEGGEGVEIEDTSVEAGEVVVAYASKQGYTIVGADDLSSATFEVEDDVTPEDLTDAMAKDGYAGIEKPSSKEAIDVLVGTGIGFDSWPDSWEDATTPARIIALDAWSSMGGTWTGCFAEIKSKRICSAFKDEMLGTTKWR